MLITRFLEIRRRDNEMMKLDHLLMRGFADKDLRVSFRYKFSDEEFATIKQHGDFVSINPTYGIVIGRSFEDSVFIGDRLYWSFVTLLEKSVKMISDSLYDLFPDVNDIEFGIDTKMLNIFRVEKAMNTNGMTMLPVVWVDKTSKCYPGIEVFGTTVRTFKFPLEDAIAMVKLFSVFDPSIMGMNMLRMIGKIE